MFHLTYGIYDNADLHCLYLCSMSPADAKHVEAMNYEQHGMHGMVGSLDCSHIAWNNCPVAYQDQFKGKQDKPTLIMEVVSDYQLYAWHAVVGYAGTLNDINVWDNSLLHKALIDGTFSSIDFEFLIASEVFKELWFLVDGIYPPLSCFVHPMTASVDVNEALFSMWQESSHKDAEHFFGVLKKKFNVCSTGLNTMNFQNIIVAIYCCIMLHNMSVVERVRSNNDNIEDASFYEVVEEVENDNVDTAICDYGGRGCRQKTA